MANRSPVRQTQEQRSVRTQQAVQEATLSLLLDIGYTRLTTAEVARSAGVSRGALTHQFASKEDLVVRSISHQLDQVTSSLNAFAASAMAGRPGVEETVDHLWATMSDGLFYITMEYLPEARHNPPFRDSLIPVVQRFHGALDLVWAKLASANGLSPEQARVTLNATMCLIRGMVAQSVLRDEPGYFTELLTYWKRHLRAEIAGAAEPSPEPPPSPSR